MPQKVLTIVGPTASGKTRLAVELALRYQGEVVSCDSMQIYRHMDIGTAKPTTQEMSGVPHHMLDTADPTENYSAARYVEQAAAQVDDILSRGKLGPSGGTGPPRPVRPIYGWRPPRRGSPARPGGPGS